jgi:hypothetical protein
MVRLALEQRLGSAATVFPDGTPNVSPKGTTPVWERPPAVGVEVELYERGAGTRS